jgi:G3E family GTPase
VLPAIVLGGWLGAGKTTLVNRLLRAAGGRRIAVLVNDFGEAGIDADLIESRDGSVMNLAGGCVCCAIGSDLLEALIALPRKGVPFDLVLVETSGVALPASVARAARLAPGVEVEGVVVLVDAETVRARADDRHVGDMVRQQLAEADLLLLNKVDLLDDAALPPLRAWLSRIAPRAPIVETAHADVPPELVLGLRDAGGPSPAPTSPAGAMSEAPDPGRLRAMRPPAAASIFASASFELEGLYDLAALAATLADPALGLLRAKGTLRDAGGSRSVIQAVGARVRTGPAPPASPAAADDAPRRLVVIGLREALDPARIGARLAAARRAA